MKKCKLKHGHGFFTIACMLMLLTIPIALYAATYNSDTDGDGQTETITTTSTCISIYHPRTGSTSTYTYYNGETLYIQYVNVDTDGQPGNEIIVKWINPAAGTLVSDGIDVICDRTKTKHRYNYYSSSTNQISPITILVADTDGQLGNEIIVKWTTPAGYLVSDGIDVICDRTQTKHTYNYYSSYNQISPAWIGIADTDGQLGNEIIVKWTTPAGYLHSAGIDVIVDRTQSTQRYNYYTDTNQVFPSAITIADTDGKPGKETIVKWNKTESGYLVDNGIDIIHSVAQSIVRYGTGLNSPNILSVRDYDKIAGAEVCYNVSSSYSLIIDRTSSVQSVSSCTNTDPSQPPVVAITPPTGSSYAGTAQNFTAVYSDANAYTDITRTIMALRTTSSVWTNAIYVKYERATNSLYLYNDAATAFLGPCTPGSANTISNSKGTLNCAQTSVSSNGNDLTVNWNITPKTTYTGAKKIYLQAVDNAGLNSGLIQVNTWTIH